MRKILLLLLTIYLLLAFKDPFGTRSLIPNLEPYPDTLYYATPAWNLIHGRGFNMHSSIIEVKQQVAPLYSIYLVPFFAVFRDARSFYFANMILIFASVYLFWIIVKNLYKDNYLLVILLGFLFVTNYYIYTLPSLLMAETASLLLFLGSLHLYIKKFNKNDIYWMVLIITLFPLFKLSNIFLSVLFALFFGWELLKNKNKKEFYFFLKLLLLPAIIFTAFILKTGILIDHKNLNSAAGFNLRNIKLNIPFYLTTLFGGPTKYLWFNARFAAPLIGLAALLGIFKSSRQFQLITILSILGASSFYAQDARFIVFLIPMVLIFFGAFLSKMPKVFYILFLVLYLLLPGQIAGERNIITFKKQLSLNFKYAETPWNYNAVQVFNKYFNKNSDEVYLGTVLPIFYVDYFSNGNYKYLPITKNQDFFENESFIKDRYFALLKNGNSVYISNAYLGNLELWKKDYNDLVENFEITLVKEECLGSCNIYKLNFKDE